MLVDKIDEIGKKVHNRVFAIPSIEETGMECLGYLQHISRKRGLVQEVFQKSKLLFYVSKSISAAFCSKEDTQRGNKRRIMKKRHFKFHPELETASKRAILSLLLM